MTDPMFLIIAGIGSAFLLLIAYRIHRGLCALLFSTTLLYFCAMSVYYLIRLLPGAEAIVSNNAGIAPPVGISLRVGFAEAVLMTCVNLLMVLGSLYLHERIRLVRVAPLALLIMIMVGLNGLIMTRDLFNLFVFLEILSIATYAFLALNRNGKTLSAGFNYLIAGGLASSFLLLGIILVYQVTGVLNIDVIVRDSCILSSGIGFTALLLIVAALLIELKPFPANGWALDLYESVDSGTVALISVGHSAAVLAALYKIMPLLPEKGLVIIFWSGLITFVFSNLGGLKQQPVKRMLGFSSAAQIGLITAGLALTMLYSVPAWISLTVIGGLFLNHFFAKAVLFWLAGIVEAHLPHEWQRCAHSSMLMITFGAAVMALIGLPPFPGFYAKWFLFHSLASNNQFSAIGVIALGSLFEAAYLLRWFGSVISCDIKRVLPLPRGPISQILPPVLFVQLLFIAGLLFSGVFDILTPLFALPLLMTLLFYALDFFSSRIKGIAAIAAMLIYGWYLIPQLDRFGLFFAMLFLGGSAIVTIATLNRTGKAKGFFPLLMLCVLSTGSLLIARTTLQFFYGWEVMAVSSYLLIIRGKKAQQPSWLYILFSFSGALLMLTGYTLASTPLTTHIIFSPVKSLFETSSTISLLFILAGFLIKTAAFGVHLWLPGSYAEADDDVSVFVSAVLSKVGIFGMMMILISFSSQLIVNSSVSVILGWVGILTAFFGTLMAVFQEDIKYLLAYSSMGQIGLIILSVALMDHMGWVSALYLSFNHFLFKGLLFLAFAGVLYRTKTRNMYEMGGLIKRMPISFVSVLIAIIALSGVPPLSGFGGKWLLFTALMEKGWYLQLAAAFFSSTIAFLYCFRLIHAVFLGQAKAPFKTIHKAPVWLLIPQFILIGVIMAISMMPQLIIKPIITVVQIWYPSTLSWKGGTLISNLGYWNGFWVMNIVMVLFGLLFFWMLIVLKKPQKVKQFNIVFAAERPHLPETTHVAHNFFAHYQKALGFLVLPRRIAFWNGAGEWVRSISGVLNNIYTGNGQTYAIHIILYIVVLYLIASGV